MIRLSLRKKKRDDFVLAIDIGSYKTCAVLARLTDDGYEIVNFSQCISKGIKKGNLIDKEAVLSSINTLIQGFHINEDTGIILSVPSIYTAPLTKDISIPIKKQQVSGGHISRLMETAFNSETNIDREIIHVIPIFFYVDEDSPVKNPLNLKGDILGMKAFMIVAEAHKGFDKLKYVCERSGMAVTFFILSLISSSVSTLTNEEKDRGALLLDIGGGKTEIGIFKEGRLRFFSSLPIGGNHFTNDLSIGLGLPFNECERIKKIYSEVYLSPQQESLIEALSYDGRIKTVTSSEVFSIINPRAEELFLIIKREIQKNFLDEPLLCVVLTGGCANMSGICSLAQEIFDIPVRIGTPSMLLGEKKGIVSGLPEDFSELVKPEFSSVLGTAVFGLQLLTDGHFKNKKFRMQWLKNIFN
ncbi:MAG: cell division protein FtsA [Thermodesulfovibrionales bacterium]